MKKLLKKALALCACLALAGSSYSQPCDSTLYLRNAQVTVGIAAWGGAITHMQLASVPVNPFTWQLSQADMPANNQQGAPFRGHFLCLGRWGAPTEGEIKAGVPHNGEPANRCWQNSQPAPRYLRMQVDAPLDAARVQREVWLDEKAPVMKVTETVQSTATVARPFNLVQHATIGPPFLDTSLLIDCNAGRGFLQALSYPQPQRFAYSWPQAVADSMSTPLHLRSSATPYSYVSTHVFEDSIGWVSAYHPRLRLLLAYVWRTADYPWINVWQQWRQQALWAKGLEFGTTGIGRSYQDLLATDTRFEGRPSLQLLDAGEEWRKTYWCVLTTVPADWQGVQHISWQKGVLQIQGRGSQAPLRITTQLQ